jgi:hypothetical protein
LLLEYVIVLVYMWVCILYEGIDQSHKFQLLEIFRDYRLLSKKGWKSIIEFWLVAVLFSSFHCKGIQMPTLHASLFS